MYKYCCPPAENNEYKVQKKLVYLFKDIGVTAAQSPHCLWMPTLIILRDIPVTDGATVQPIAHRRGSQLRTKAYSP